MWTDWEVVWSWSWRSEAKRKELRWVLTTISRSAQEIHLVDHVALGMQTFVYIIPIDLHELPKNCTITPYAFRGKANGVVEMTIDIVFMFVIWVPRTEDSRTNGTREILDMVFFVWGSQRMRCKDEWNTTHCMLLYNFPSKPDCTWSRWDSAVGNSLVHIMGLVCHQDHR